MQLNISTDYAIRSLLCLALEGKPLSAGEIANRVKIPQPYLISIMAKLKKAGLVSSYRGKVGGYHLAIRPSEIPLWKIINVMEQTTQVAHCLENGSACSCFDPAHCPIRGAYYAAQNNMEDVFRRVTLEDLKNDIEKETPL
jgi:Rrf2 family protein